MKTKKIVAVECLTNIDYNCASFESVIYVDEDGLVEHFQKKAQDRRGSSLTEEEEETIQKAFNGENVYIFESHSKTGVYGVTTYTREELDID